MNSTLIKALVALVPTGILFAGGIVTFLASKTTGSILQILGAGLLVIVVFAHIFEALQLFLWMHWGSEHSAGHYLDLRALPSAARYSQ
jgi:hypothetical protein